MRFQILHESSGRLHLRADVPSMSVRQADLLDAWIRGQQGVESVTVRERTRGITVTYQGCRSDLIGALSAFSYRKAENDLSEQLYSSRVMNRNYKEKLTVMTGMHYLRRLFLPAPVRMVLSLCLTMPRILKAIKTAVSGHLTVDVLDGAAIAASLLTGDFTTADSVHFLLNVGDTLEEWTHRKSVEDLARSMALQVDQVWRLEEDGTKSIVPLERVVPGDLIVVNTGHVLPLDGILEHGDVMINQASLTGESVPVAKSPGSAVYAGSVVEEGNCVIRVTHSCGENRYDRIIRMIEESENLKSEVENRAGHLADRLVPWCLGGSLITWLLTRNTARAVAVLMVDYSCALKLSVPISVLSAMREAGRHKITVKGGKYLEKISHADTVIFDKTGTLTRACPTVIQVVPFGGEDENEMLRTAACLEEHFPHSVANAVVQSALEKNLEHREMHSEVEYVVAHGIVSKIDGRRAVIGSAHFIFEDEGVKIRPEDQKRFDELPESASWLYLGIGGFLSAAIAIFDPLRPEAKDVIDALHREGIGKTVMLTGDSDKMAVAVAGQLGIDDYRSEVLPEDKAEYIRKEQAAGHTTIMIGDGINDTPALSLADVGVALGSGAVIAREVAEVTISAENLNELVWLKCLSDALMKRINHTYRFVMGFNSILIALGAFGILTPAAGALLHNTSTIVLSMKCLTNLLKPERN